MTLLFAATANAGVLRIAWDPNPETTVTGYRVRYGLASRIYTTTIDVGNRTTYDIANLSEGTQYYVAVQAYTADGLTSPLSAEVTGMATSTPIAIAARANILLGTGNNPGAGGWFGVHGGAEYSFSATTWGRLPWATYNNTGGGTRLATGDVDGDGADEVIVGLGRGSNGWVAVLDDAAHGFGLLRWIQVPWAAYNAANGEVFPAVGNLDGDAAEEIVLGLGTGGQGFFQVVDDANQDYKHLGWPQVAWGAYNAGDGSTHPAVGDVDGTGASEIIVGLGTGGHGYLQVVNGVAAKFSHRTWVQVPWATYNLANGTTYPALGDLDGDGRAELVAGLGKTSDGWFAIFEDAATSHQFAKWDKISWAPFNTASGESHPAVGNLDGDVAAEIVLGLGEYPGAGGWFEIRDDAAAGYKSLGWKSVGWDPMTVNGVSLYPAIVKR